MANLQKGLHPPDAPLIIKLLVPVNKWLNY